MAIVEDDRQRRRSWTAVIITAMLCVTIVLVQQGYERHRAADLKVWQDAQAAREQAILATIARLQTILLDWSRQHGGQEPNVEQTRELLGLTEPLTFDAAGDAHYVDPTNGVTVRLWFRDQTFWTGVLRTMEPSVANPRR